MAHWDFVGEAYGGDAEGAITWDTCYRARAHAAPPVGRGVCRLSESSAGAFCNWRTGKRFRGVLGGDAEGGALGVHFVWHKHTRRSWWGADRVTQ